MLRNKTKINKRISILDIINCRVHLYNQIGIVKVVMIKKRKIKEEPLVLGRMEKKANGKFFYCITLIGQRNAKFKKN